MSFFSPTPTFKSDSLLRGLNNTKNTCFLNAVVQNFSPLKKFHIYLEDQRGPMCTSLMETLQEMTIIPASSTKSIWPKIGQEKRVRSQFANGEQQDSSEFFVHVMDWCRDEERLFQSQAGIISIMKGKSKEAMVDPLFKASYAGIVGESLDAPFFSSNPFSGIAESTLKCAVCGHKSTNYTEFFHLGLPLEASGRLSIEKLLKAYTEPELVSWRCDSCCINHMNPEKKSYAKKQVTILRPPDLLCLHVQRLQYSGNRLIKRNDDVEFGHILDLSKFSSYKSGSFNPDDKKDTIYDTMMDTLIDKETFSSDGTIIPLSRKKEHRAKKSTIRKRRYEEDKLLYSLTGIVIHLGDAHGGHYVALRRLISGSPVRSQAEYEQTLAKKDPLVAENTNWAYISDSSFKMVEENAALNQKAYMLFYEKI